MAKGIKQASKAAQYRAKVATLADVGTDKAAFDTQLTVIEDIAGAFIERVKNNLEKEKVIATGKIEDITLQAEDGKINIYGYPWLIYQDRGVNGSKEHLFDTPHAYTDKRPPVSVFRDWIKERNIQLRNEAKYGGKESDFKELDEEKKITSAAWAISTKIYKEGFKPRNVYSKEIPQLVFDLQEELGNFAIDQVIQQIDVKESARQVIVKM